LWPVAALRYAELHATLKAAGRGGTRAAGHRLRAGLVVSEIALALALVVLSGLIVRSYFTLIGSDLGVQPRGVVVSTVIGLPDHRYATLPSRANFDRGVLERLNAIPGIDSAALAVSYPLSNMEINFSIGIVGRKFAPGQEPSIGENTITPAYFRTLGIPVLRGRAFTGDDTAASEPVAIVNQSFARMYGKNGNAIGMRIHTPGWNGTPRATRTIVGVVADQRENLQNPPRPVYYVPMQQGPINFFSVVAKSTTLPAASLSAAIRTAVTQTDPAIAAPDTNTFAQLISQHSQQQRSIATLLASLALVALLLALFGIFGVVSYSVNQRYGEFGVRVALGAQSSGVLSDVLLRAFKITAVGAAIGLGVAAFGAQAVGSQLYQVSPLDPLTFTGVVALILICASVAALLPALRATRIDPATALRYE
jgi:putative ABC transport system permease protein